MTCRDQRPRTGFRPCALLIAGVILLAAAEAAHAGTIWIEWDRSPDPAVVGYRVSVGTSPGVYTETFDVGSATSFVYQASDNGRLHYLAVTSYAAGPRFGALSPPVSAYPRLLPTDATPSVTDARSFYQYLWTIAATQGTAGASSTSGLRQRISATRTAATACWTPSAECLTIRTLAAVHSNVSSLTESLDGRLFFVEGGQRIGLIASDVLQQPAVLVADSPAVRLNQVVLDPAFTSSGFLYVGESETRLDGTSEFRIVRHRVVQNQSSERTVVTSIPLSSPDSYAPFAVSAEGHIYVAIPAANEGQRTVYSGMLLRLNADGTSPDDQHGSAIFATGYESPTSITLDEQTQRLWLAGVDGGQPSVSSLGERTFTLQSPIASLTTSVGVGGTMLLGTSDVGGLGRALVDATGSMTSTWQLTLGTGLVRSVTAGQWGNLFVAVETQSSTGGLTTSILRLTPAR